MTSDPNIEFLQRLADPAELGDVFQHLASLKGTIGLIASSVFLAIRLYRLPDLQPSLPFAVRWENLPVGAKYAIISVLALSGSLLASAANHLSWQEAILAGISAMLAAIATNKLTKTASARAVAELMVPPQHKIDAGQ